MVKPITFPCRFWCAGRGDLRAATGTINPVPSNPGELHPQARTTAGFLFGDAMHARIHPTIARALAPFAPPASEVHHIISEAEWEEADRHYLWLKTSGELDRRHDQRARELELQHSDGGL